MEHVVGRELRVEGDPELGGVLLLTQTRVSGRSSRVQRRAEPGEMRVEGLERGRARRLDLAPERRLELDAVLEPPGEQ